MSRTVAANLVEVLEKIGVTRRIDEAGIIVIMCGAGCHCAAEELRALPPRR